MNSRVLVLLVSAVLSLAQARPAIAPDAPLACWACEEWNQPQEPFKVFGNTYYVGTAGLSAVLVTSDAGLILLDAGLPQSAPLIDANIRKLGFRTEDVRLILNSHAHYDHSGGIAALQRASGAIVAATPSGAQALQQGYPTADDPQYTSGRKLAFPPVREVKHVKDGEVLRVGPLQITAHATPGHTPGATTWSWRSCEGTRCVDIVYADSLNPVSDDEYRFSDHPALVEAFRRGIAKVEQLPCDVLLAPHPSAVSLPEKLARQKQNPAANPFIESGACRAYAALARKRLDERLATEKK